MAFVAVCRTGRGVCRIDRPAWADGAFHAGGRHHAGCGCSCLAFGVCLSLFRRSGGVVVRPYVPVLPYASGDISRLSLARELFRRYYALLSCPSHAAFQLDAQRRDVGRRLGGRCRRSHSHARKGPCAVRPFLRYAADVGCGGCTVVQSSGLDDGDGLALHS